MLHEAIFLIFFLSTFVLAQRDVVLLCRERHCAAFCNRLGAACSELTNTPIPQQMAGDEYILPEPISKCIVSEYYLAVCYVEYSPKWCNAWKEECGIESHVGQYTDSEKECMENKKFIAVCNARYGNENCAAWVKNCKIPSINGNLALNYEGRTCITTQWVLLTCVSTFGQEFCTKLERVCCSMYSIPVPEGTFHILPEVVTECMSSGDTVIYCKAKYSDDFCNRLGAACSEVTNSPIPQVTSGDQYELPEPILECISSENFVAVCYAKYGRGQCQAWMQECKVTSSPAQLTDLEQKCMESSMFISTCYNDYGVQKCLGWSKICNAVDANGKIDLGDSGKDCIRTQWVLAMCVPSHGQDICNRLEAVCCSMRNIPLPTGPVHILPANVTKCISSEDPVIMCKAKYGPVYCNRLGSACSELTGIPIPEQMAGNIYKLPDRIFNCIASEYFMAMCYARYGADECNVWKQECNVENALDKLTPDEQQCMESKRFVGYCYKKYGEEKCIAWSKICKVEDFNSKVEMNENDMNCILTQRVLQTCLSTYGLEFCTNLEASCIAKAGLIFPNDPVHILPASVTSCISSADAVFICNAKYGSAFCSKLGAACSELTNTPIPQVTTGVEYTLPSAILSCIASEQPMAMCIARYGVDSCKKLEWRCYKLRNIPFVGSQPAALNELPPPIEICIKSEIALDSCAAKYGKQFCKNMETSCDAMLGVTVSNDGNRILSTLVVKCITSEHPLAACRAQYGEEFCDKLMMRCYKIQNAPFVKPTPGTLYELPPSIATCIVSETVIDSCASKYGMEFCNSMETSCASMLGINLSFDNTRILPVIVIKCMKSENSLAMCRAKFGKEYCDNLEQRCYRLQKIPFAEHLPGTLQELPNAIDICIKSEVVIETCVAKHDREFCVKLERICATMLDVTVSNGFGRILPAVVIQCISTEHPLASCRTKYDAQFCDSLEARCYKLLKKSVVEHEPGTLYDLPQEIDICMKSEIVFDSCAAKYGKEFCTKLELSCAVMLGVSISTGPGHVLPAVVIQCMSSEHPMATCRARYGAEFCDSVQQRCYQLKKIPAVKHLPGALYEIPQEIEVCIRSEIVIDSCEAKYGKEFCSKLEASCATMLGITIPSGAGRTLPTVIIQCISKEHPLATCRAKFGAEFCDNLESRCYKIQKIPVVEHLPGTLYELPHAIEVCIKSGEIVDSCATKYNKDFCNKLEAECATMLGVSVSAGSGRILPSVVIKCISEEHPLATCRAKYGTEFCNEMEARCYKLKKMVFVPRQPGTLYDLPEAIVVCMKSGVVVDMCVSKYGQEFCSKLETNCASMLGVTLATGSDRTLPQVVVQCVSKEHPLAICRAKFDPEFCDNLERRCYRALKVPVVEHLQGTLYDVPQAIDICIKSEIIIDACRTKHGKKFCNELVSVCATMLGVTIPANIDRILPTVVVQCVYREHPLAICRAKFGADYCDKLEARCYEIQKIHVVEPLSGTLHQLPHAVETCLESEQIIDSCVVKYGEEFCSELEKTCAIVLGIIIPAGSNRTLPALIIRCISTENPIALCRVRHDAQHCKNLEEQCYNVEKIPVVRHVAGALVELPEAIIICMKSEEVVDSCVAKYGNEFCTKLEKTCATMLHVTITVASGRMLPSAVIKCISEENPLATCRAKFGAEFCDRLETKCYQMKRIAMVPHQPGTLYELPKEIVICMKSEVIVDLCVAKYGEEFCTKMTTVCATMLGVTLSSDSGRILPSVVINCISREDPLATCLVKYGEEFCREIEERCYELQNMRFVSRQHGTLYELPQAVAICVTTETVLRTCITKHGREYCRSLETSCASMLGITLSNGFNRVIPAVVIKCVITEHPMATCRLKYGVDFCDKLEIRCFREHNIALIKHEIGVLSELPQTIVVCIKSVVVVNQCIAKYGGEFCKKLEITCSNMLGIEVSTTNALPEMVIKCISTEHPVATCETRHGADFCHKLEKRCYELQNVPFINHKPGTIYEIPQEIAICIKTETVIDTCVSKYGREFCSKLEITCASMLGIRLTKYSVPALPAIVVECLTKEDPVATCRVKHEAEFCDKLEARCFEKEDIPVIKHHPGSLHRLPQAVVICMKTEVVIDMCVAKYGNEFCTKLKSTCASMLGVIISTDSSVVLPEVVIKCISTEHPVATCVANYGADFCSKIEKRCYELQDIPFIKHQPGTLYEVPHTIAICITTETVLDTCVSKYGREFCKKLETTCAGMLGIKLPTTVVRALPVVVVQCITKEQPVATCRAKYGPEYCDKLEVRCYQKQNIPIIRHQPGTLYELPQAIVVCIRTEVVIDLCVAKYSKEFCTKLKSTCASMLGITIPAGSSVVLPEMVIKCISTEHPIATCVTKYGAEVCSKIEKRCYDIQSIPFIRHQPGSLYEVPQAIAICITTETVLDSCISEYGRDFCVKLEKTCASLLGVNLPVGALRSLPAVVVKCITEEHPVATCTAKYGAEFCDKLKARCYQKKHISVIKHETGTLYELPQIITICMKTEVVMETCAAKYGNEFCKKLVITCGSMIGISIPADSRIDLPEIVIKCISVEHPVATCITRYGADLCSKIERRCYELQSVPFIEHELGTLFEVPQEIAICIKTETVLEKCTAKYGREFCRKLEITCASMLGIKLSVSVVRALPAIVVQCVTKEHPVATCVAKYGPEICGKLEARCYEKENIPVIRQQPGALRELPQAIVMCIRTEVVVDLCGAKYGKEFCVKLKGTCANMLGIAIPTDTSVSLPELVIKCISTEHPVATCTTKYGADFCSKIEKRCYKLQDIPFVKHTPGTLYEVPQAIAICITTETILDNCISKYDREFCMKLETTCASMLGINLSVGVARALPALAVQCITKEHPVAMCRAKYGLEFCDKLESRCYKKQNIPVVKHQPNTFYELPQAVVICIRTEVVVDLCVAKYGKEFCTKLKLSCASMLGITMSFGSPNILPEIVIKCISNEHPVATCITKYGAEFCDKIEKQCYKLQNTPFIEHQPGILYEVQEEIAVCISTEAVLDTCVSKYGREFCRKLEKTCASMLDINLSASAVSALPALVVQCIRKENPAAMCRAKYGHEYCNKLEARCYQKENIPVINYTPGTFYELPEAIIICIRTELVVDLCYAKYGNEFCIKLKSTCANLLGINIPVDSSNVLPEVIIQCISTEHPIAICITKYGADVCNKIEKRCYELQSIPFTGRRPRTLNKVPRAVAICITTETMLDKCISKYDREFCEKLQVTCASMLGINLSAGVMRTLPAVVVQCITNEHPVATCRAKYGVDFCDKLEARCYQQQNIHAIKRQPGTLHDLPQAIVICIKSEVVIDLCAAKYEKEFCLKLKKTCATMLGVTITTDPSIILPETVIECISKEHPVATCVAKYGAEFCNKIEKRCYELQSISFMEHQLGTVHEIPQAIAICIKKETVLDTCISKYGREFCRTLETVCASMLGIKLSTGITRTLPAVVVQCVTKEHPVATCRAKYGADFCDKLEARCYQKENIPTMKHRSGTLHELPQAVIVCMKSETVVGVCAAKYGIEFCTKLKRTCATMLGITLTTDSSAVLPETVVKCISKEHPMASCTAKYGADFCTKIEKRCYELQSIPFSGHQLGTLYEMPQAISMCLTTETILDKCVSKYDRQFCRKLERTCASILGISIPNGVARALPAIVVQCITKEHPVATCRAKYGTDFCDKLEARCYQQNGIPAIRHQQRTLPDLPQKIAVCLESGMIVDLCAAKYGKEFCIKLKMTCAEMIGIKIPGGSSSVLPEAVIKCLSTEHPVAICLAKYGADFCSRIERRCYELQSIPFVKHQPGTLYEVPQVIAICITTETVLDTCLSKYGREFCRTLETSCASIFGVNLPTGIVRSLPAVVVQCITKEHPVATCRAKYGRDFCDKLESRCYQQQNIPAIKSQQDSLNELPQAVAVCIKSEVVVDLCAAKYSKEFCMKLKSTCAEMLGVTLSSDSAGTFVEIVTNCVSSEHPMATCMAKYGSDFCKDTEKRCYDLQNIPFIKPKPGTLYELPLAIANCLRSESALDECVLKYDRKTCENLTKICASMLGVPLRSSVTRALPAAVMQCITKEHPLATCKAKYGEDFCNNLKNRCYQKSNMPIVDRSRDALYELPQEIDQCIRSEVVTDSCVAKYGKDFCKKLESTCASMLNVFLPIGDNRVLPIAVIRCISSENPMVTCTAKYGSDFCNNVRKQCQKLDGKGVTNNKMNFVYDLPQTMATCIASEVTLYSCVTKFGSTFCDKLQMTCASLVGIPLPLGGTRNLPPAITKCIATEHPVATCVAKYGADFCNELEGRCYEIQSLRAVRRMPGALFELPQAITNCISSETARHTCVQKHGRNFCKKVEISCASMLGITISIDGASILSSDVVSCLVTEHPMATCVAKYGSDFCNKLKKRCSDMENIPGADRNFGPMYRLPEATVRCMNAEVTLHSCISKYGRQFCGKLKEVCASIVGTFVSPGPVSNLPANIINCMASEDPVAMCIAKYGNEVCQKFKQRCYDAENVFIIDPVPGKSYQLPEAVAVCIQSEVVQYTCLSKYDREFCRNMETACATILEVPARRVSSSAPSVDVIKCISSEHPLATCVAKYGADFCNPVKDRCMKNMNPYLSKRNVNALYDLPQEIASCISSETVLQTCLKKYGREFCKKLESICSSILAIPTTRGSDQAVLPEIASCISSDHTIVMCIAKYGKDFCNNLKRRCSDAENVFDLDEKPGALYELPKAIAGCMFSEIAMHECTLKNSRKYCEKLQGACFKMLGISLPSGSIRNLPSKVVKCMTSEHPVATCVAKYGSDFCSRLKERCYGVDSKIISEPRPGLVYELPEIIASCMSSELTVKSCASRYGKQFCNQLQLVCSSMLRTPIPSGNDRQLPSNVLKCISTENALAMCMAKYGAEFCNALKGRCYQSQNMPVLEHNLDSILHLPDAVSACISLEVALHYCKSKYDSQFCTRVRATCSNIPAQPSPAPSTHGLNNALATCIFSEIAMYECTSKNDEEYCKTLEAVCRLMLGIPISDNGARNIPPSVGRCMSSGNAMATCAAKFGTEFCSSLKGKCSNMLNLPATKFESGTLLELPEALTNCILSEVALQSCMSKYDREFCFKLETVCISMLGASVTIGPTHPLAKVVADCVSSEHPLAVCQARYDASFCNMLQKRCSQNTNGSGIKNMPGSLPLLPQPLMDCLSSEILISSCISSYGLIFCSKLESGCSALHGVPVSSAPGHTIPLIVRKCISSEFLAARCTVKYGFGFCNRSKQASSQRLNLAVTPYIPDVEELNCYVYHGFFHCVTMMNLCLKSNSSEGRPLAVSEWECIKSQIAIANCKTLYGPQCEILQEECAVATGSARVKIGNGGIYQMCIPLRNCISEGGAIAMCKVHHDQMKCNTWKVQCSTALGLPMTSTVIGKYEKLPTQVAVCVSAQDIMARCRATIGANACDLLLDECKGRFGSPTIMLSSNSLYSLSPPLINCIQHRYKRTSPIIRQ